MEGTFGEGKTALCVGGPFDGMEHEASSLEFTVASYAAAAGARPESGVYRYDAAANVYRWQPQGRARMGANGEELEREGDEAVYDGDLAAAKVMYGGAISAYLEKRDFEAAVKTCRKMIRVAPEVARARFTLAFLLIGQGALDEAKKELVLYADAVREAGAADFAIPRLQLLAHATSDGRTRDLIKTLVADLGGSVGRPGEPMAGFDAAARWERVLDTVLKDSHA